MTDFSESASYDSFEPESDPTIEEDEDRLPPEIEDDESEDSDFELESSSAEEESTESENEDENTSEPTTSNKENEPADPKKAKKKRSVTRYFNKFYQVQIQIIYQKIKGLQLKKQQP